MEWTEKMVSGNDLQNIKNQRSKPYIYKVVQPELLAGHEQLGWTLDKTLKKSVKIRKEKPIDEAFEDRVWVLFAKMGFQHMNKDRHLEIPYVKENPDLTPNRCTCNRRGHSYCCRMQSGTVFG